MMYSSRMLEYWTGMSQPPKSTILAPMRLWTALSGVTFKVAVGSVIGAPGSERGFHFNRTPAKLRRPVEIVFGSYKCSLRKSNAQRLFASAAASG